MLLKSHLFDHVSRNLRPKRQTNNTSGTFVPDCVLFVHYLVLRPKRQTNNTSGTCVPDCVLFVHYLLLRPKRQTNNTSGTCVLDYVLFVHYLLLRPKRHQQHIWYLCTRLCTFCPLFTVNPLMPRL